MPTQGRAAWWLSTVVTTESDWAADEARFRGRSAAEGQINREIDDFRRTVAEVMGRYELIERRVPLLSEAKRDVDEALGLIVTGADMRLLATEVFDLYSGAQATNWTESSLGKLNAIKSHLIAFNPELLVSDINDAVMQRYYDFLTETLGFRNSTIHKQLVYIRAFLRWAANNGYYSGNSHNTFHPRIKGITAGSKEIIYCTKEEVRTLMSFTPLPSQSYLARVRDVFVFCCFTGLRYSDVAKLRNCDVHGDEYISVVTQKTSDALRIELNSHSAAILHKYRDPSAKPTTKALPVISNVKMNVYLKELGKAAGLDAMTRVVYFRGTERCEEFFPKYELLTTHCARRTFVVSALQLGIPPEVIMRWTGHSSYEAMKPYVAIVDELKRRSMDKFNFF